MGTERPDKDEIFNAAAELDDAEERAAFLDQACAGDSNLKAEIVQLLEMDGGDDSLLDVSAPGLMFTEIRPLTESPGDAIGPYKLLQQIGEGGMGVVYMAEQTHPVARRVALKIIKPGMDTRQVIARFEVERQALAMMDHPNIAKVLDAGTTSSGRPYFVMELVKGIPVTQYCDEQHLTPRERLEVFLPICQAVQHAHQKGIIHRDLKPSNILIAQYDDTPVPKIIDFGVAKAISDNLTEKTMFTQYGQIVGTIEYMSPEQARFNQLDVDTRSDVYSLGVLLYELLAGETPIDKKRLRSAAFDELLRIIREEEPPRPSTKLSSSEALAITAINRKMEPKKLSLLVRGELDWIVMKALAKDRARRYETANGFAADVQRYLADEPVSACPPSAGYRFRKFVRRNKQAVCAASLFVLALVAAVISTSWSLIREQQHSQALQTANERARQAIEMIASDQAIDQLAREKELRPEQEDFLGKMIQYYTESARGEAATEQERSRQVRAYYRIGRMYQILGRSQDSENALRRVVVIIRQLADDFPTHPEYQLDLAHSHNALGTLLKNTGRPMKAEAAYVEGLNILNQLTADFPARPEFRQALAGVHNNLGNLFHETGRLKEAEDAHAEALAIRKQLAADFPTQPNIRRALAMSHNNLGWVFQTTERLTESEAAYRDAVALQRQHLAEHPNQPEFRLELAKYLFGLGNVLRETGRPEAEAARAEALVIFRQLVAEFPNRPEFRQELTDRGLQEDRGVGDDSQEESTSDALDASDFSNK